MVSRPIGLVKYLITKYFTKVFPNKEAPPDGEDSVWTQMLIVVLQETVHHHVQHRVERYQVTSHVLKLQTHQTLRNLGDRITFSKNKYKINVLIQTRVRLDYVTILNRILKLNWNWTLDSDLDLDCDNILFRCNIGILPRIQ